MSPLEESREQWKHLYTTHLPELARARDPAQKHWPVYLDHCFARIVLDNSIGQDRPWNEVIKSPAIRHMNLQQFGVAIELAEKIATGQVDLVALDERSLEVRGKQSKQKRKASQEDGDAVVKAPKKMKKDGNVSTYFTRPRDSAGVEQSCGDDRNLPDPLNEPDAAGETSISLKRIADSNLTTFRKQTLSLLCQIPRGRYSTYGTMSDFISTTSHKTCARAVGNAMRNNPFAPAVPCHRVLAGDGSLGGFGGSWGENGRYASEKHKLLAEEGVKFDSTGKVKGRPFDGFMVM